MATAAKAPTAPKTILLFGSGHDPSTRLARIKKTFPRPHKQVRIDDILVRPGQYVRVTEDFVKANVAVIKAHYATGMLQVRRDPMDIPLTVSDLDSVGGAAAAKPAAAAAPAASPGTGSAAPAPEPPAPAAEPESIPDEPAEDISVDIQPLPDGWESATKKEMVAMADERGIDIPHGANKSSIADALMEWAADNGF